MPTRRTLGAAFAGASLAGAGRASAEAEKKPRGLAIQVSVDDPAVMTLALGNAVNVATHYGEVGEEVEIEFVAYGPGLHMLRADTSPVKDRVKSVGESIPGLTFTACGNTIDTMKKAEGKEIPILPGVTVVQTGVVRLMELQEKGWTYIRP